MDRRAEGVGRAGGVIPAAGAKVVDGRGVACRLERQGGEVGDDTLSKHERASGGRWACMDGSECAAAGSFSGGYELQAD